MASGYAILVLHAKSFFDRSAARDRRRLARPSRLPRAAEIDPRRGRTARRTRSSASATSCCGCGRPSSRSRCSSAWDTLDVADLPQRGAARATSRAACSRTRSSSSSMRLPALVESFGFAVAKAAGLRGRRLPRRGCGRRGPGRCVVATSDRDAFQLVSERVTVLQPVGA